MKEKTPLPQYTWLPCCANVSNSWAPDWNLNNQNCGIATLVHTNRVFQRSQDKDQENRVLLDKTAVHPHPSGVDCQEFETTTAE